MEINCIESSSKLLNRKLNAAKVNQMDGGARALTLNIVMLMVDSTWRLAVIKHTLNRYNFVKCPL
jgi:hypothetical protein